MRDQCDYKICKYFDNFSSFANSYDFREQDCERVRENINKSEEDMIKITRTLQKQIDEKQETIAQYEAKLQQLESSLNVEHASLKKKYEFETNEVQRKQENEIKEQEKQMRALKQQQAELLEFKTTRLVKKQELQTAEQRYKLLLQQLSEIERQGEEDIERQAEKIRRYYAQLLKDYKDNAQKRAEKNISTIEFNIQKQNQRLEDEAAIQDEELAYLEDKNTKIEQQNEQYQMELA